jgi:hypothetical protein
MDRLEALSHYEESRREFLWRSGGGLGGVALAWLLRHEGVFASEAASRPVSSLHHPARAQRVVQLFMAGGASHIDLFDYKPELVRRHGEASDFGEPVEAFQNGLGPWKNPIWEFKPYGQYGRLLSEVVAKMGSVVDEIAFFV